MRTGNDLSYGLHIGPTQTTANSRITPSACPEGKCFGFLEHPNLDNVKIILRLKSELTAYSIPCVVNCKYRTAPETGGGGKGLQNEVITVITVMDAESPLELSFDELLRLRRLDFAGNQGSNIHNLNE